MPGPRLSISTHRHAFLRRLLRSHEVRVHVIPVPVLRALEQKRHVVLGILVRDLGQQAWELSLSDRREDACGFGPDAFELSWGRMIAL